MVRAPGVEHGVKRLLIVEITVPAIHRQAGRSNHHEHATAAAPDDLVPFAWSDHDHLVAEARGGPQLRLHIGTHTAAGGRIKSADVGDTHRPRETVRTGELQVKLF